MLLFFLLMLVIIPPSDNNNFLACNSLESLNKEQTSIRVSNYSGEFAPVIKKLLSLAADTSFVYSLIVNPKVKLDASYIKINVIGSLSKSDYSSQYNDYSVSKCRRFHCDNIDILEECSLQFGVPAEVITSILWIETKHGSSTGKHLLPTVFLSAAMANEQQYIEMNINEMQKKFNGNQSELPELEEKIRQRSKRKSEWALNELLALEKISKTTDINIFNLYGSWAGAFGWSQFLPSSYINWAVDGNNDNKIDLFSLEDAACSIANYLKSNGWSNNKNAQRRAVFHYNNNNAYVDAVLMLAGKLGHSNPFDEFDEIIQPLNKQIER